MSAAPLICLITPGNLSTTPRLVKNADAFARAGYRVHVIAGAPNEAAARLDLEILKSATWDYTPAPFRKGFGSLGRRITSLIARRLAGMSKNPSARLAAQAHFSGSSYLTAAAARVPAQLYFGHCLAALPVAAEAASRMGAHFGFDIEDFHDAETIEAMNDPIESKIRRVIQGELLPKCSLITAASPLISQRYRDVYGVDSLVLLNVFPRSQAPSSAAIPESISEDRPARLYWFSQTIGPGRGLENILEVMAKMRTPSELLLRGFAMDGYVTRLSEKARMAGLKQVPKILPPGPPDEMARLAADSDLGLSIEMSHPLNRDICLTNKIFTYLLAGIPQLLSNTSAQVALAPELGEAAMVCDLTQTKKTAESLDSFFADSGRVANARDTAGTLATTRFCWEIERGKLLKAVRPILGA